MRKNINVEFDYVYNPYVNKFRVIVDPSDYNKNTKRIEVFFNSQLFKNEPYYSITDNLQEEWRKTNRYLYYHDLTLFLAHYFIDYRFNPYIKCEILRTKTDHIFSLIGIKRDWINTPALKYAYCLS